MIGLARKFFGCAFGAFRIRDVDLEKRHRAFLTKFPFRGATGLGVACAKKYMKSFARELARNFESNPFVRAGHECDALLHFHEEISLRKTEKQETDF